MIRVKELFIGLLLAFLITNTGVAQESVTIIPQPNSVERSEHSFTITDDTPIVVDKHNKKNAYYLQNSILPAFKMPIVSQGSKGIILKVDKDLLVDLGEEGYHLEVDRNSVSISGSTEAGVFYGIQSMLQMLPLDLKESRENLELAAVNIIDHPRFSWRAFMLDESRHFKGMAQVKKLLDQMALLKMNVFHWHLTDDQGWRIEIKKYPKLTDIGAYRKNSQRGGWGSDKRSGEAHGGYYSQEQIKEIIAYAALRQITIIPEIEMPGHASAAIAAYPWLGTIGELKEVPVVFGKLPDSYNVADPRVYEFIQNVLSEVMDLFPCHIIHIGGDEVKFDAWKESKMVQGFMKENGLQSPADLQIYFTNKISKFLDKNDHRMMGWNEIMGQNVHEWQSDKDYEVKSTLATSAIIHFWKGNIDLINDAVSKGYDIVNSHHVNTYLDYSYEHISLQKAYDFDPIPDGLDKRYHDKVLGSGCQMWGEWIPTVADMDRQVFPRLAAFAEVGWTNTDNKDFNTFRTNLEKILKRWEKQGIAFGD
jgi:hexosaminidase